MSTAALIQQHLIDPEICIRCNTCEATCPVGAITHDARNYVVDADKCNLCMACIPPCPTGSIDNWRTVPKARAYTVEEQFGWDELPAALSEAELAEWGGSADEAQVAAQAAQAVVASAAASSRAWRSFAGRLASRSPLATRNWSEYWMLARVRYFCTW